MLEAISSGIEMDLKKETLTKLVNLLETSPSLREAVVNEIKRRNPSEEELSKAHEQSQNLNELIHKRENEPLNAVARILIFLLPFLVTYYFQAIPFGYTRKIKHMMISVLSGGLIYTIVIISVAIKAAWKDDQEHSERFKIEIITNKERTELGIPNLNDKWIRQDYSWINPKTSNEPFHYRKDISENSETDVFIKKNGKNGYEMLEMTYNFKYPNYDVEPWQCQFMIYGPDNLIISNTELTLHQSDSILNIWNLSRRN